MLLLNSDTLLEKFKNIDKSSDLYQECSRLNYHLLPDKNSAIVFCLFIVQLTSKIERNKQNLLL